METFDKSGATVAMEMGLPMDIVAEEVVTQDEGGADLDGLSAAMDCLTSQPSVNILSKFGRELGFLDSSEDDDPNPSPCQLYVPGQSETEGGSSDVWSGSAQEDCLCWECGERFHSLDLLMVHFRMHEASVRCNMCHVTFRRVVSLSMHLDNVHGHVDLCCPTCQLPFRSMWDLNEHLGKHQEPSELPGDLPGADPQKKSKVCHQLGVSKAPVPTPESVSVSVTPSVPVSVPITVSAPVSGRVPVSAPVPFLLLPISSPVSVPGPNTVPVASVPGRLSVPVSVPGAVSVPAPLTISPTPPSSTTKGRGPPLEESTPNALVAMDHSYNNACKTGNGVATSSYGLRMRGTKMLPQALPRQSLPESTRQKKIHLFLFHNVDQRQKNEARLAGGERDRHVVEVTEEMDKPGASTLDQGGKIKQEPADHCDEEVPWEGEPIEEDEDLEQSWEEAHSDECSESNQDSDSDGSTESMSSGNSSGSSYCPNKPQGKRAKNRRGPRSRKLRRAGSGPVAVPPIGQPPAGDSVNLSHSSGDQASLQPSVPATMKLKVPEPSTASSNMAASRLALRPSRMYACDQCREVFPEQVTYRRHHCPMKTMAIMTWSAPPAPTPGPVATATTAAIQDPATGRVQAPAARSLASSSSSGVMKVTKMTVPCSIQNSTLMSPLPVASGPVFTLPSIMLPSASPSVQSGSRALMPTVLFNSSGSAGRLTRLVLHTQGLTFPTHTLSQTRPIRLSVPSQANPSTPSQASASMQLGNLMIGSLIQPQTLVKAAHPPATHSPAPSPGTALTPASASVPAPVLITAPTPTSVAAPVLITAPTPTSVAAPVSAPASIPATSPIMIPTIISAPAPITIQTPLTIPTRIAGPTPKTISTPITGPTPVKISTPITRPTFKIISTSTTGPTPKTIPNTITDPTPLTAPAPLTIPTLNVAPATITAPFLLPAFSPLPDSFPRPAAGPLKILGMFANCSQELALQKRLEKSWRSKGVFLCRQCGAVSRQPSLGVRHRYLHRGSRRHRCHCGRTFLHRLHLLRHHVQHAEATRFVCAPCGRTFSGARCLARHKRNQQRKRKKRARSQEDCHAPFSCDCGLIFQRPAAFLWHKLKNPGG